MPDTFKDRLKILMQGDRPYSFARKCGIDKGLFQNYWQKGKIPTYEALLKLQRATGCSIDWLLTGSLPSTGNIVKDLSFKPAGKNTGERQRRLLLTARQLKAIYEQGDENELLGVEVLLRAVAQMTESRR